MAKTAKKPAPPPGKTLFDLPESAPRRLSGMATRGAKPRGGAEAGYTARDIEVPEGLEPVRRRPGMYIGGTDEKALHHLFAEVIDNSMDEALEGHASSIQVETEADGFVTVTDNGRGIPVDPHPKFKNKSALEVIMCTLHTGGKFDSKVYGTSGGITASACRSPTRCPNDEGRGRARADAPPLVSSVASRKASWKTWAASPTGVAPRCASGPTGTFGAKVHFKPERVFKMARSKANLFGGVEIRWPAPRTCCARRGRAAGDLPFRRRPQGISVGRDQRATLVDPDVFADTVGKVGVHGGAQSAVAWTADGDGLPFVICNTIPTPDGGTDEFGLRGALLKGIKDHAERMGQGKRAAAVTGDDVMTGAACTVGRC